MQRCCPVQGTVRHHLFDVKLQQILVSTYATRCATKKYARNATNSRPPTRAFVLTDKPAAPLLSIEALPARSKIWAQSESQESKTKDPKDYSRSVDELIATTPPELSIVAIKHIVSSSSIPSQLQNRITVSACYSFLHHGKIAGALAMYKLLTSMRFAPPISLIASLYRAAIQQNDFKPTTIKLSEFSLLSTGSINIRSLVLLLSVLEKSRHPEVMENVVQDYATQISSSCLTDGSVVASMIRGYCAAKQLDGCYTWFYRFRNSISVGNIFVPAAPYLCLMTASRKLDPTNTKALYRISKMMQEDNIPFIVTAYNEILQVELRNRNFTRVFNLYSAFQDGRDNACPDAYTFSLLFDAFWKNETGPRYECALQPNVILHRMIRDSESNQIALTTFNINAALRYFVYAGDFHSAVSVVNAALSGRVSPNSLTVRWTLEELLKRCLRSFDPSASFELENWTTLLLGGLTRDHYAHAVHLLDVVRSTRGNHDAQKLTRPVQDALQVIFKLVVTSRSSEYFSSRKELRVAPVLSRIRDILNACANLMHRPR